MKFGEHLIAFCAQNVPVIQLGFSPVHTVEKERRDLGALPIVIMTHFDEHRTDHSPTHNQIQAHCTPRSVYFLRSKNERKSIEMFLAYSI